MKSSAYTQVLHDEEGEAGHCCGLDDAMDARMVADKLGIPFYVMDLREAFRKAVMDDFVENYKAGRTPNPCVRCNGVLKPACYSSARKPLAPFLPVAGSQQGDP